MDYTTQLYRDYFISHEIRIPINQPVLNVAHMFFVFSRRDFVEGTAVSKLNEFSQVPSLRWTCRSWAWWRKRERWSLPNMRRWPIILILGFCKFWFWLDWFFDFVWWSWGWLVVGLVWLFCFVLVTFGLVWFVCLFDCCLVFFLSCFVLLFSCFLVLFLCFVGTGCFNQK